MNLMMMFNMQFNKIHHVPSYLVTITEITLNTTANKSHYFHCSCVYIHMYLKIVPRSLVFPPIIILWVRWSHVNDNDQIIQDDFFDGVV